MRKARTPAGFVPKPLRNRSRKNAETSLLEPIRKKGIYAQTMRNRSQKTAETLLLEPTKNAEKRKMPKRCFWNLLKTKKKGCLKQGKPLRNVKLGSLQATRPNSRKRCLGRACEKAEPQQVLCPSHCETAAGKMPKRRFWNPLKRKKCSAQTMRNRSQKTAETSRVEPTKNKEKKSPQARQTFAQRKTWKPASHQAKLKKKVFGTRMRKGRTPAGFVPKPLRNRSRKNAETSLLEPIKKRKK